jgi:hypothetical protein
VSLLVRADYLDAAGHRYELLDSKCTIEAIAINDRSQISGAVAGVGTGKYKGTQAEIASLDALNSANAAARDEAVAAAKADLATKLTLRPPPH